MSSQGRERPYTNEEIAKLHCVRCGESARRQWSCCANGSRWLPLCNRCDCELNWYMLKFFRVPERPTLMAEYEALVASQEVTDA